MNLFCRITHGAALLRPKDANRAREPSLPICYVGPHRALLSSPPWQADGKARAATAGDPSPSPSPVRSFGFVRELVELLDKPPPPYHHDICEDPWWPWKLAASRHDVDHLSPAPPLPFQHTIRRKRTLEDTIHVFYLCERSPSCRPVSCAPASTVPQPDHVRPLLRPARPGLQHHR